MLATAPVGTGQRKNEDSGKQNGGSSLYYLKMPSFTEIVQVADGQKDPPRKS